MWIWPGDMGWNFVSLNKEISKTLREAYPKSAMIKIKANIVSVDGEKVFVENKKSKNLPQNENKENLLYWNTSLFRNKKDENYIMPIKKDIRKKLGLYAGEVLEININIL